MQAMTALSNEIELGITRDVKSINWIDALLLLVYRVERDKRREKMRGK